MQGWEKKDPSKPLVGGKKHDESLDRLPPVALRDGLRLLGRPKLEMLLRLTGYVGVMRKIHAAKAQEAGETGAGSSPPAQPVPLIAFGREAEFASITKAAPVAADANPPAKDPIQTPALDENSLHADVAGSADSVASSSSPPAVTELPSSERNTQDRGAGSASGAASSGASAGTSTGSPSGEQQSGPAGEISNLLSYGLFTWSISPDHATKALGILSALEWRVLKTTLTTLEQKLKDRFFAALPPAAKHDPGFTKILCALGGAAVREYTAELLAFGRWDWAEGEPLATEIGMLLSTIASVPRIILAQKVGTNLLHRIFDASPEAEVLGRLLGIRFKIRVGADDVSGIEWDAPGLRRAWNVFETLPALHLGGSNASLVRFVRQAASPGASAGGYYQESEKKSSISYDPAKLGAANRAADPGDPLFGVNRFDKVVRHEVGHAVDAQLGASARYCVGNTAGGNWRDHGSGAGLAATLVSASNSGIQHWHNPKQKAVIIGVLQSCIDKGTPLTLAMLRAMPFWHHLDKAHRDKIKHDTVCTMLQVQFESDSPWYRVANGGYPLADGRIYQESYRGNWVSYDAEARSRKVSLYQFRAPGEWFAEAYATYYEPDPAGHGVRLASVDPTTKAWFDRNIDNKIGAI